MSSDHWEKHIRDGVGEMAPYFITPQMSRRFGLMYLARLHAMNLLWPARNLSATFRANIVSSLRKRLRISAQILVMAVDRKHTVI